MPHAVSGQRHVMHGSSEPSPLARLLTHVESDSYGGAIDVLSDPQSRDALVTELSDTDVRMRQGGNSQPVAKFEDALRRLAAKVAPSRRDALCDVAESASEAGQGHVADACIRAVLGAYEDGMGDEPSASRALLLALSRLPGDGEKGPTRTPLEPVIAAHRDGETAYFPDVSRSSSARDLAERALAGDRDSLSELLARYFKATVWPRTDGHRMARSHQDTDWPVGYTTLLADLGDHRAEGHLGLWLYWGDHCESSWAAAERWLLLERSAGGTTHQYWLVSIYANNFGEIGGNPLVDPHPDRAVTIAGELTESGDQYAAALLDRCLEFAGR